MGDHRGIPKPSLAGDHSSISEFVRVERRLSAPLLPVYAPSKENPANKTAEFFFCVCFVVAVVV